MTDAYGSLMAAWIRGDITRRELRQRLDAIGIPPPNYRDRKFAWKILHRSWLA